MNKEIFKKCCLPLASVVSILLIVGCSGDSARNLMASAADTNIKKLGALYLQFQLQNTQETMVGPGDENEFKEFIRNQNPDGLEFIGVDLDELDAMFIGDRDNKPLKIRWGIKGVVRGAAVPVLFEQDGVEGKFMVGFNGFEVREVDKSEYDRMLAGEFDVPGENAK